MVINYVAAYHFYKHNPDPDDPFPLVRLFGDNAAAESWMSKACTSSLIGRALGRVLCALMIDNPVGTDIDHVTSEDNEVSDRISRIKSESNTLIGIDSLLQDYPKLSGCRQFQPSSKLISLLMDAISQKKLIDPLEANSEVLATPGRIIS